MGSNASKPNTETTVPTLRTEKETDPRSPTPEITRTPLHGKGGGKHNITKNVDLRKTFENANDEEKLIHNNPILSAVIKNHLHSYDPRSPTVEFERTPIIISKINDLNDQNQQIDNNCTSPSLEDNTDISNEEINTNLQLLVPKNLCEGFFDLSMNDTIIDQEEPLGSSTASNEAIENNISNNSEKPTKLLETNFEYIESPVKDVKDELKGDPTLSTMELKNIASFEILDNDPRSPSLTIERTPIVIPHTEESSEVENVEEMSDATLLKVLQNTNEELKQNLKKTDKSPDGLLIYEDELLNDTPKKSKVTNNGSRTPLSCMKNKADTGHARSKSANTLYDPKNHSAQQKTKRASHIPRLKSLTKQAMLTGSTASLKNISRAAVSGDCENTPPHSHRDIWDKDNSIVL